MKLSDFNNLIVVGLPKSPLSFGRQIKSLQMGLIINTEGNKLHLFETRFSNN